jgi:hypothetical protein
MVKSSNKINFKNDFKQKKIAIKKDEQIWKMSKFER